MRRDLIFDLSPRAEVAKETLDFTISVVDFKPIE
jgi:hypothetical protein